MAWADIPSPEQFLGFRVGADKKLARWDKIVEYLGKVASASDRVRVRDLGKTTQDHRFVLVEISAADTISNLDHYKALERRLYFQSGAPTAAERDDIFRNGKAVVAVTCNVHSTEIGSSQMVLELVYRLATEDSPLVKKILDNTILLLVPSLNPDGQILVTDWYNKNVNTPFEASPMPWLYHPYVGHDNNRDMYLFSQKESRMTAELMWHDWFPSIWLDEHQMGSSGARIFVMPATDPINPNVHPLIYRLNGFYGQSQAAALEAAGKEGIIYNSTYTNFWEGAHAWSGWWHNQVGLLTEVASARIASPIEQRRYDPSQAGGSPPPSREDFQSQMRRQLEQPNEPLPPPRDVTPRTEYPRPWLGGRWTLRDIVDYELIATMGLLETAADSREQLLRQIYEVNRSTLAAGANGEIGGGKEKVFAILIPAAQHDMNEAIDLAERLRIGGVRIYRASEPFDVAGSHYGAGTFIVPMDQVFARYAKDLLEKQTYPEVRRTPSGPPEPPYDVTAWSLGMQFGVDTEFASRPLPDGIRMEPVLSAPKFQVTIHPETADSFWFDYLGARSAYLVNRLLRKGAQVRFASARVQVAGVTPRDFAALVPGFDVKDEGAPAQTAAQKKNARTREGALTAPGMKMPRIGLYQSWTANMDEGWTRWVLDQYAFPYTALHNADLQAGGLRARYDAIVLPDQRLRDILQGLDFAAIRPEYRGGIGDKGLAAIREFLAAGGTLVTLGEATSLVIDKFPVPVRDLKKGLTREQHFAPGSIVNLEVDVSHPLGRGMAANTYGFYNNSPFFQLTEGFSSQRVSVVARYPNADVLASGWLRGADLMAGRAAVVAIETNPGKIVLFGIRPQHRAQTHATLLMLFNALYWSVE